MSARGRRLLESEHRVVRLADVREESCDLLVLADFTRVASAASGPLRC